MRIFNRHCERHNRAFKLRLGKFFDRKHSTTCHPDRSKIIREADDLTEQRDLVFWHLQLSRPKAKTRPSEAWSATLSDFDFVWADD